MDDVQQIQQPEEEKKQVEEKSNESLEEIEGQLINLATKEVNHWAEMAKLMIRVEDERLYEGKYSSFSKWVKTFATQCKLNESLFWAKRKAGKFYLKLKSAEEKVEKSKKTAKLPEIEEFKASPVTINIIKDITGNNINEARKLLIKVNKGETSRKELIAMKAAVLKQREMAGIKRAANGYESRKNELADPDKVEEIALQSGISASKILLALQNNSSWIPKVQLDASKKFMRDKYKSIYRVLAEFPVETGDAKHVRRIDAFILENITAIDDPREMVLRGVEIKISKGDLLRDGKMSEYTNFCDYFYIAIPPALKDDALSIMPDEWGLLLIEDDNITVEKEAKKCEGLLRSEALSTALYEVL